MKLLLPLLLLIGTLHAEDNAPEEEEYSKDFLFFLLAPEIERQIGRPFESSEEWNRYKKFATEECTKKKNHHMTLLAQNIVTGEIVLANYYCDDVRQAFVAVCDRYEKKAKEDSTYESLHESLEKLRWEVIATPVILK